MEMRGPKEANQSLGRVRLLVLNEGLVNSSVLELRVGSVRALDIETSKHANMTVLFNARVVLRDGLHSVIKDRL